MLPVLTPVVSFEVVFKLGLIYFDLVHAMTESNVKYCNEISLWCPRVNPPPVSHIVNAITNVCKFHEVEGPCVVPVNVFIFHHCRLKSIDIIKTYIETSI